MCKHCDHLEEKFGCTASLSTSCLLGVNNVNKFYIYFYFFSGITNHDEYSLVRESPEDEVENKPNYGTLTLKKKKEEKERDAKMEQLRKKLKTDDEGMFMKIIFYLSLRFQT